MIYSDKVNISQNITVEVKGRCPGLRTTLTVFGTFSNVKVGNKDIHYYISYIYSNQSAESGMLFSCFNLSATYDPRTLCSGTVDYSFVVLSSSNLTHLDSLARQEVQGYSSFINSTCLSAVKRLVCASVYLKCFPNGRKFNLH
jgi:hypothetical protein